MNRIIVTISIDVPDGATVNVSQGAAGAPSPTPAAALSDPYEELPPVVQAPPQPVCPFHHKPLRNGKFGPFCPSQASDGSPANEKGYCNWRPPR